MKRACPMLATTAAGSFVQVINDPYHICEVKVLRRKAYRATVDGKIVMEINAVISDKVVSEFTLNQPKLRRDDTLETRQLKELLLLHLDLIQQQQETLIAKDAQLKALTQEKNALRCRLERMDRRMGMMRHNAASAPRPRPTSPSPTQRASLSPARPKSEVPQKTYKRRGSLMPQNLTKRFKAEDESDQEMPIRSRSDTFIKPKLTSHRWQIREQDEKLQQLKQINKQTFITAVCQRTKRDRLLNRSDVPLHFGKPRNIRIAGNHDKKIERTDYLYPVNMCTDTSEMSELGLEKSVDVTDKGVQVPKWKIVQIPRGYQMEGTENLDDEIYLKRHQKPETEEKRRKRWDMQRVREERQREKLQLNKQQPASNTSKYISTFLPSPYDAQYLEVQETVPVTAFGRPVPSLPRQEFSLPWFNWEKREREEKNRSCRKRRL